MPAVCDDGDEAVVLVEEVDVPDAKSADHVEGTSRPRGETQPMPVTTTLRKGGARVWADMVGTSIDGQQLLHSMPACLPGLTRDVWWRCGGSTAGGLVRRRGRLANTIHVAPATSSAHPSA